VTDRRIARLCAASFLVDFAHYLVFGGIPFLALRLGANAFELGLVPVLFAVTYVAASTAAGRLSDRMSRLALVRAGIALFLAATLAIAASRHLALMLAIVPVTGVALGLFWPPVQGAVADLAGTRGLAAALGTFNVSWSAGKGLGFLFAGLITHLARAELAIASGVIPLLVAFAFLPRHAPASHEHAAPEVAPAVLPRFLILAWVANAVAYGVSGVLNVHAPAFLLRRGEDALDFGVLLGAVFVVQTFAFAATRRLVPGPRTLAAAHAAGLVAIALFLAVPGALGSLVCALPLGIGFALAYHASLYASLHRPRGRGFAAGIHEAVLAIGGASIPFAAGTLAAASGSETAPFVLCLVLLALALLVAGAGLVSAFRGKHLEDSAEFAKERQARPGDPRISSPPFPEGTNRPGAP
jgi:MFS family permease